MSTPFTVRRRLMGLDPVSAVADAVAVVAGLVPPPLSERARLLRAAGRAMRSVEWHFARWRSEARPRRRARWEGRLRSRVWVASLALDGTESSPRSAERRRLRLVLSWLNEKPE